MSAGDIIILSLVAVCVIFALASVIRRRRKGGCSGCCGCCSKCESCSKSSSDGN